MLQIKSNIKRGDIYYINSANTQPCGSEQGSNRPGLIVSNNKCNTYSPVLEVVYLTSKIKRHQLPTHVRIMALYESTALCEQVHSVAKERLGNYVGHISAAEQQQIDKALRVSIGLEEKGGEQVNELIKIGNQELESKEFKGQRVVTFKDIDLVHERVSGTADRNFRENKERFIESEDYFILSKSQNNEIRGLEVSNRGVVVLTEQGYLMLVKSFTDDLAWQVQRDLVNTYFRARKPLSAVQLMELQFRAIKEVNTKVEDVNKDLQTFKKDLPLLGIEESRITCAVKRRGVNCLSGKESVAYQDKSLRGKVYSDIYGQLKREFGVASYKAIKRNQCELAISIIDRYQLPAVLQEQIMDCNSQRLLALG